MPRLRRQLTPARIAACAALASVAAVTVPTLIGFYVSLIAVAVLLGTAFAAYLAVVDDPHEWAVFELGA
jgi:predicted neutral ceramidase superfamily lipid hydrolase